MVLAITRGYDVLSLFLVTNLLCCTAAVPIALGLIRPTNRFFTETGCVFGIVCGVLGVRTPAEGLGAGGRCLLCLSSVQGPPRARGRARAREPVAW